MNMDPCMNLDCFAEDQVHFNRKGYYQCGKYKRNARLQDYTVTPVTKVKQEYRG